MARLSEMISSPKVSEAERGIDITAKFCCDMGPENILLVK
jgi:hypothetical protein